jgi:hypothetical protein
MFTIAECRAHAEEKLAQADHDPRHRRRLIAAAEAWLLLAGQLRRKEKVTTKARSKRRVNGNGTPGARAANGA